jgi:HK97 family phage major capsid protein
MTVYETKADGLDTVFETGGAAVAAATPADNAALDALKAEVAALAKAVATRPVLTAAADNGAEERKAFVDRYLRKGDARGVELKALSASTGADGGFAVPEALDAAIASVLKDVSPIRAIANVVSVGSANYRKLVTTGGTPSGWVAEIAARPETDTPDFTEIAPPMGELYANPAASQTMLDDAMFDVEAWLAAEIAMEFARAEGQAFVAGTGTGQPKGFAAYATSALTDAARAFGTLQHLATGAAGGFGTTPEEKLIDLVHALRPGYRQNASFVMNSATLARIRKMKDGDGNFLWRPGLSDAAPATLLGYPVVEAEDMPDVAANSLSVAFGDFRRGYVIAESAATRVLRDPFSNKPFVHFYATKRVGGAVVDSNAIKLLKFSAS